MRSTRAYSVLITGWNHQSDDFTSHTTETAITPSCRCFHTQLAWRAQQWIYRVWTTGHTGSLGAEGSGWSGWEGWIIPEFSSAAAIPPCRFVSWLENWCCVSTYTQSPELFILSTLCSVLYSFSHLKTECHTGKVTHPFALNDTARISFKYLAFILRGELCVVKHSAVLGIWHFFPNVDTVIFFM